jgi:hypothetical protein
MFKVVFRFGPILGALLALAAPAPAANDQQIKTAIQSAVRYLKSVPVPQPRGNGAGLPTHEEGPAALAGIALMEAGVDPGDAHIQSIAKVIRDQAVKQTKSYQLALDIIFLDKLGEQVDTTLIQSMGVRLLGGQSPTGTWTYECPGPDEKERARLSQALGGASMKGKAGEQVGLDPSSRPGLDPALGPLARIHPGFNTGGDLSNTQFAVLGLWAARRHGVPVDEAMARLEQRLRQVQAANGSWAYYVTRGDGTAPMTCSGLLGLAITAGNRGERSQRAATLNPDGSLKTQGNREPKKLPNLLQTDKQVQAGFNFLAQVINGNEALGGPGVSGATLEQNGRPGAVGGIRDDLYFMWSLERACVVYNVGTHLGKHDWHAWGCDALVRSQSQDGSWVASKTYGRDVDTSFALMFLCRSNIVKDLSGLLANRAMKAKGDGGLKPSTDLKPSAGGATVKGPPEKVGDTTNPTAMAKDLATATGTRYAELLKQYTESKGPAFTQALAEAIPQLTGDTQKRAREALAERMARFSAGTLKERLHDPNAELRRASALAVCMRDEREMVPDLIEALGDADDLVVRGARLALKEMSEKDFGPAPGATAEQKRRAAADWKAWWEKQKK